MKFDNNQEFTNRDISPDSKMNNTMYEIDTKLSKILNQFNYSTTWKKFFICSANEKKDQNPKEVVIEFNIDNGGRCAVDWIDTTLRSLNVDFKYINVSSLLLMENLPLSHGNGGRIFIRV